MNRTTDQPNGSQSYAGALGTTTGLAVVVIIAVARLVATPATAVTFVPAHAPRSATLNLYQRWADESLMPTPDLDVPLALTGCRRGIMACAPRGQYIRFPDVAYLAGPEFVPSELVTARLTLLHELGHIFDFNATSTRYRAAFKRALHMPNFEWFRMGFIPLREKFAMAYSYCAAAPASNPAHAGLADYYGSYDYTPTLRQHLRTCQIIRDAARANDWRTVRPDVAWLTAHEAQVPGKPSLNSSPPTAPSSPAPGPGAGSGSD